MADARTLVDALLGRNQPALASEVRGEGGALSFVPRQQTYAQSFMNALRNIPQAIQQGFQGNAFGTAEPNNAVSDLERQRFWRGSVMGQDQGAQSRNMERALAVALAAPTVYHGSPHKFDAFDSSKIGTGEGAQAYGHGIYFAENPKVAQDYAVTLAAKNGDVGGRVGNTAIADAYKAIEAQANRLPPAQAAPLYNRLDLLERLGFNELPDDVLKYAKDSYGANSPEVSWLQTSILNKYKGPGNLYKVDLPDAMAAKMLDWDKPLSQQPKPVRDALMSLDAPFGGFKESPAQVAAFNKGVSPDLAVKYPDVSGNQIYTDLMQKYGGQAGLSKKLQELGIPGIRYLDQGSRGPATIFNVGAPREGFGPYSPYTSMDDAQRQLDLLRKHGFHDAEIRQQQQPQTYNYVAFPGTEGMLKILERK